MATLFEQLAQELGTTPQALGAALNVGVRSAKLDALRAVIEQARQLDGVLTASEEESLAPLRQQLAAAMNEIESKRSARRNLIAANEAHWNEQRNQSQGTVNVPVWADLEAQLRGE